MADRSAAELLRQMFDAAVAAAMPERAVPPHLPPPPGQDVSTPRPFGGRVIVVGAGKASAAMAAAVEAAWPDVALYGLVITRYDHAVPCSKIEIVEASHPVPDAVGSAAARRILELARAAGPDDLVLALISGGGSSLMALPADGLTLDDKQAVNKALLRSGASIDEMNAVRKHLSAIKGGRLAAAAHPARLVALMISDVPGDDPAVIASGPTVADPSTCRDALDIIAKYGIELAPHVKQHLEGDAAESIKPGDPRLAKVENILIATPQASLEAAAEVARQAGITPVILGDSLEGESRDVAKVMAGIAKQVVHHGQPAMRPCVLLSGGETTVTVKGDGQGGRNVEFLLALAVALAGEPGVAALAADTDGVDGAAEVAGAWIDDQTLAKARNRGVDAKACLARNDGHGFFAALGQQVVTGPTLTNVNDFRAVLIA